VSNNTPDLEVKLNLVNDRLVSSTPYRSTTNLR
jgi:hypothetical protein